jgi:hypothetical protein
MRTRKRSVRCASVQRKNLLATRSKRGRQSLPRWHTRRARLPTRARSPRRLRRRGPAARAATRRRRARRSSPRSRPSPAARRARPRRRASRRGRSPPSGRSRSRGSGAAARTDQPDRCCTSSADATPSLRVTVERPEAERGTAIEPVGPRPRGDWHRGRACQAAANPGGVTPPHARGTRDSGRRKPMLDALC